MGDYFQNMVMVFVPETHQNMVPAILSSVTSEHGPFDFERIMPSGRGGGIAHLVTDMLVNKEEAPPTEERFQAIKSKSEKMWGCTSNSIYYDHLKDEDHSWVEELEDHYGYDDQPQSIKINWRFDTKNGIPEELAERFVQRAADLGLGAMWYYSSPNENRWNPVTNQHEDYWELIAEATPNDISETQRIRNANATDDLFNVLEELP